METVDEQPDVKSEVSKLPEKLTGFADRLLFIRVFVARCRTAAAMAELLGCPYSTYATWENGSAPHDKVAVATKVEAHFGRKVADWLLRGGETFLFPYKGTAVTLRDVSQNQDRLFKLPPSKTDTLLTVA